MPFPDCVWHLRLTSGIWQAIHYTFSFCTVWCTSGWFSCRRRLICLIYRDSDVLSGVNRGKTPLNTVIWRAAGRTNPALPANPKTAVEPPRNPAALRVLRPRVSLQWRNNGHDGVLNHQTHDWLLNRLFRRRSKKTSKLRVTGLCARNSLMTGEFPAQRAINIFAVEFKCEACLNDIYFEYLGCCEHVANHDFLTQMLCVY